MSLSVYLIIREEETNEIFSANITHNLSSMAKAVGLYCHLWRPGEIGIERAEELIDPLLWGLDSLENDPGRFKKLNPLSGWGTYRALVDFVRDYLEACKRYPNAEVSVQR